MSILRIGHRPLAAANNKPMRTDAPASEPDATNDTARSTRGDVVDFSDAARAQNASAAEHLPQARIETIRARIDNGFYNRSDIADVVAHRLLESGDLAHEA